MSVTSQTDAGRAEIPGLLRSVKELHPGYFAYVMATGIVSTGVFLMGPSWLSRVFLVLAALGFVILAIALLWRLAAYREAVVSDVLAPDRVFGFFTLVAGMDVLGVRLALSGHPLATAILAGFAVLFWLVMTYGIPATLLLRPNQDSVLGGVNGNWLIWVVATQSLSTAASLLVPAWPSSLHVLAPIAIALWGIGLILYLTLISLIVLRWLSVAMTPMTLGPPYWILMGATAITVLAGARILALPITVPIVQVSAGFIEAFCFVLWSFGTWWIPLLLVLGFWRHARWHWPLTYEPTLWSVVFPLGMYSVATFTFGKVAGIAFMESLGRVMIWVAMAAWLLVSAGFVARAITRRARGGSPANQ